MTWTRLSEGFSNTVAMVSVSDSAYALHVRALEWCNTQLTDGALPTAVVGRAVRCYSVKKAVQQLVDAGVWEPTDTGWQLDWSDQETAEAVKVRRDHNAKSQRLRRERLDLHNSGDHTKCYDSCWAKKSKAVGANPKATGKPKPPTQPEDTHSPVEEEPEEDEEDEQEITPHAKMVKVSRAPIEMRHRRRAQALSTDHADYSEICSRLSRRPRTVSPDEFLDAVEADREMAS